MINEITISRAIIESYLRKFLESIECDVAVVGGGPSGLVASYYLAKAGFNVVLFEKRLSLGGGIWGGGIMFNKVIVQTSALEILDEFGVNYEMYDNDHYIIDAIELAGSLIYNTVKAGVKVFNLMSVEDVMIKDGKIAGLVLNWGVINVHVDPIAISTKVVIDATGHDAAVCNIVARKTGQLKIEGEKYMNAELGEKSVVEKTSEVFPGLFVTGMAVAVVYGLPRMGPIFGGMLLSGKKVADLIINKFSIEKT